MEETPFVSAIIILNIDIYQLFRVIIIFSPPHSPPQSLIFA